MNMTKCQCGNPTDKDSDLCLIVSGSLQCESCSTDGIECKNCGYLFFDTDLDDDGYCDECAAIDPDEIKKEYHRSVL